MTNIYCIFNSRSESLKFHKLLNSYGIASSVVSTPMKLTVACSLSVKINSKHINDAKMILSRRNFAGFNGMWSITSNSDGFEKAIKII